MVVTHVEWKVLVSQLAALLALRNTERGATGSLLSELSTWATRTTAHSLPLTQLPAVPPPVDPIVLSAMSIVPPR
jgi:hypothetical protein